MAEFELTLPIALPGGSAAVPIIAELAGELTEEEVIVAVDTPLNVPKSALARITERHKALARAIAGGMNYTEAAGLYGMLPATVSSLMSDPAFKNLVSFYSRSEDEVFRSTQERLADMTNLAVDRIVERLDDDEEVKKIPVTQILAIAAAGADRTGNGPQSTSVAVNVNANIADRMKQARERAAEAMKDVTPKAAAE